MMINIKDRLKDLQKMRGLNNNQLAKISKLNPSVICSIYTRSYEPSVTTLNAICVGLEITLSEFFSENEKYKLLSEEEKDFLILVNKIPDKKRKAVMQFLQEIIK